MIKTVIGILRGQTNNVIKICEDIMKNDRTFHYQVVEPSVKELKEKFESLLILYSPTMKMANERGGWFVHKCRDAKVASYFWIKEATNKKN
jgi:hypothetical protein